MFKIFDVYLAIAPAPVNELLWDSEDSFLSEMSPQRDWALEDNRVGLTSMQIIAEYFCLLQRCRKCIIVHQQTLGSWPQTCFLHFQWQPAPHRVLCWSNADDSKRNFHCRSLPCCYVWLCWPKTQRHREDIGYTTTTAAGRLPRCSCVNCFHRWA